MAIDQGFIPPDVNGIFISHFRFHTSQHPYSEENFAELLFAVQLVKVEGRGAKPEYMRVVNSYFSQLIDKLNEEESYTFTTEVGHRHNPCMLTYIIIYCVKI